MEIEREREKEEREREEKKREERKELGTSKKHATQQD